MLRFYLILTFSVALSVGSLDTTDKVFYKPEDYGNLFEDFIKEYGRKYNGEEKELRFEVFKQRLEEINKMNLEQEHATYGITDFADYTKEEVERLNGLRLGLNYGFCKNSSGSSFEDVEEESWDWREKNVVTEVKNQRACGACWAFSAVGNIESQYAIHTKKLVRFSEQQFVDCDWTDMGCGGGLPETAFRYAVENGVMAEKDYPYIGFDQFCIYNKSKVKLNASDCISFQTDEEKLKSILVKTGPLAIAIDASFLTHYKKGIDKFKCISGVNHGVLLVGYGTENGVPYWLCKNSWGKSKGENGYFRMHRGSNNRCVLLLDPATIVLK